MNLSLNPDVQQLIADRVNSGHYASAEEVVTAALVALTHEENFGNFAPGELDALIAEGEASGEPIDGKKFFEEWRALRESAKSAKA